VWPANHRQEWSVEWAPAAPDAPPWDSPERELFHFQDESVFWPPNHDRNVTATWYPEHEFDPPGPQQHVTSASVTWPPSHQLHPSRSRVPRYEPIDTDGDNEPDQYRPLFTPSTHQRRASDTWPTRYPGSHETDASNRVFPPNHLEIISVTWGPSWHLANVSVFWPAGHYGQASETWPADEYVRWPPTHFEEVSSQDPADSPAGPLPRIFPEGHVLWTTAKEILPFLPDPVPGPDPAPGPGDGGG
jgi:hypothetical protein